MDAIRMIGIVKCFGPVRANDGIDLIVGQQEIHCLLGENGTGKSTLMNILFGLYHPDAGEIFINEKKAAIANPNDAYAHGNRNGSSALHAAAISDGGGKRCSWNRTDEERIF